MQYFFSNRYSFSLNCIIKQKFIFTVDTYNGSQLRLTKLERKQMGAYFCIASNDVPPSISKRVSLSVHCKFKKIYIFDLSRN